LQINLRVTGNGVLRREQQDGGKKYIMRSFILFYASTGIKMEENEKARTCSTHRR
jgi:hypothetical protein